MYILKNSKTNLKYPYHEMIVPWIFVALWIAGLALSIINPQLPYLGESNSSKQLLSSLTCIYGVFICEVVVTFTDIHYVYRLYNAKKLLWEITYKTIIPNILFTLVAFVWFYYHQEPLWLIPFVFLSSIIKLEEVWLANNGDNLFIRQQKKMKKENVYIPQKMS